MFIESRIPHSFQSSVGAKQNELKYSAPTELGMRVTHFYERSAPTELWHLLFLVSFK